MYLNEIDGTGQSIENPLLCIPVDLYEIGFNNKSVVQLDRILEFVEINAESKGYQNLKDGRNSY
jgi:hypothetical protein